MFDQMNKSGGSAGFLLPSTLPTQSLLHGEAAVLERLLSCEKHEELLQVLSAHQTQLQTRLKSLITNPSLSIPTPMRTPPIPVPQPQYIWKLALYEPLLLPICKGKYFSLQICLEPIQETVRTAEISLPIIISLETSDVPGQSIDVNMSGFPIIRGESRSILRYDPCKRIHICSFRLKITEVSSHYVNGWIRVKVAAEGSEWVQALILEDVVVRAKEKTCRKFREREMEGLPQRRVRNRKPIVSP